LEKDNVEQWNHLQIQFDHQFQWWVNSRQNDIHDCIENAIWKLWNFVDWVKDLNFMRFENNDQNISPRGQITDSWTIQKVTLLSAGEDFEMPWTEFPEKWQTN
jgi:hypothetical protein